MSIVHKYLQVILKVTFTKAHLLKFLLQLISI